MTLNRSSLTGLAAGIGALALLGGCAQMPAGPTVAVMPSPNKPFEVFVQDDQTCRQWSEQSIARADGRDPATERMVGSTVAGVAIGALAGAALGGNHNAAGAGAAIGGLIGASNGANGAAYTAYSAQQRYDIAYQQCMYSRGNVLPQQAGYGYRSRYRYQTPPAQMAPPPPPSMPPPPPPPAS